MMSRLVLVFLFVVQTNSLSVLTDDKSQATKTDGETVLVRQLLNQETLIRMALDRKVNELVKGMTEMKKEMATNSKQLQDAQTKYETNNQLLQDAKKEIAALKNENSAFKAEWQVQSNITTLLSDNLKTTINSLKQSQNSQRELSSAVSSLQAFQKNVSLSEGKTYLSCVCNSLTNFQNLFWNHWVRLLILTFLYSLKCAYVNNQTRTRIVSISVKDTPVGFTAGMTSTSTSWRGDILVFPYVITNKGQGYSSSSGKFTAPRDGTYVFALTAVSYYSNHLRLDIVHDGDSKVRTLSHGSASFQTGTNLVVLELDRGDAVWVKRYGGQGYYTDSVPLTTFSGFLL
ncbi:uncharacterized protein LOC111106082 [Crassostrea virginica]